MGPFLPSKGKEYILIAVDYVQKWVVNKFIVNNIFSRFGCPRAIISHGGSHFTNSHFRSLRKKYGVHHRVTIPYHPQVNGQVEVSNREVKNILKNIIRTDGKDWPAKLPDALWAYHTAFKTPIGMSPFRLIHGKPCRLLVELEHRAYCAIEKLNLSLDQSGKERLIQLQELQELRKPKIKPFMISTSIGKIFIFTTRYGFIILVLNSFQGNCAQGEMVHMRSLKCLTMDRS